MLGVGVGHADLKVSTRERRSHRRRSEAILIVHVLINQRPVAIGRVRPSDVGAAIDRGCGSGGTTPKIPLASVIDKL